MTRRLILATVVGLTAGISSVSLHAEDAKPLRVLLVSGGGFHDYDTQHMLLAEGINKRANIEVVQAFNPDKTTKTQVKWEMYNNKDWAKGYDVVIHDECSADVTDPVYVNNIIDAHRNGVPAVNLHCAMHSYRWGNFKEPVAAGADNSHWYEMLGMQSTAHGPQEPIAITYVDKTGPIGVGMADWTTIKEELYNNVQVLTAKAIAKGKQTQTDKKTGVAKEVETIVVWTNEFGPKKTHIFSTTIGHNNETVNDDRYLDLVTRGILWAAGKLGDDGKPVAGYGPKSK